MPVPTIALYGSPPSSVCSEPYEFDFNGQSTSSTSASASPSQKPVIGGISALLSSPSVKSSSYSSGSEESGSSFRYSSLKRDQGHQSPVSVLHRPSSSIGSSSRSPPVRPITGALYESPPSSVCSAPYDFDFNGRSTSSTSASASPSPSMKSSSYSSGSEELGSLWHESNEEWGSSFRYSSLKRDQGHQSPVSLLHRPSSSIGSSSRSPPVRPITGALYASPPSSVSSAPYDFDVKGRSTSSTSASASPSQKPVIGGLSALLSSPSVKSSSYSSGSEELGSLWHERNEELGSSFRYSSLKRDQGHQSPVSVLHRPSSSIGSSSRSPPVRPITGDLRISGDINSIRSGSGGGLFNGFVRDSMGSCVDYDYSPGFQVNGFNPSPSSAVFGDELTFNMEDNFTEELEMPPYARYLLSEAQSRHLIFRNDFVIKAFYEAEKAHRGQMRASGHPYLQHCVETAVFLATIGANATVVAAGLLHDTVDDSSVSYDYIFKNFGAGVSELVEGVSKLSHLSKLARENNTASKTVEADRLHTMFLAMADARAVLIKLADRLHNMMTLDALPIIKQQRFVKETLEIFPPLANRLGISTWKEQLENLCFMYLNPDQHQELSSKLAKFFDEAVISSAVDKLEQALKDGAIFYHCLCGRHRSLYSIYSKSLKKKLNMDEIHDIHGLRLIVETEDECYKALRIVHQLWGEIPGRFKDYIVCPKFNGYRSLHTVVIGEGMVPLEVQIRTKEMHLQAEYGFAAHWRYKEGDCEHSSFVLQMVEWARWVVTWQCEAMSKDRSSISFVDSMKLPCTFPTHSVDCPFSCKPHCVSDGPVFVILIENDKISVQELPANSSIMDLLERTGRGSYRWTPYGFPVKEELRPRLNHEPVTDPTCKLKMGDVVELTPAIPDKSLTEYREEIQPMYDRGLTISSTVPAANTMARLRS